MMSKKALSELESVMNDEFLDAKSYKVTKTAINIMTSYTAIIEDGLCLQSHFKNSGSQFSVHRCYIAWPIWVGR